MSGQVICILRNNPGLLEVYLHLRFHNSYSEVDMTNNALYCRSFTETQPHSALQIDVHAGDTVALKIDPPPAYPLPARLRRVGRLMPPLAQRLPVPAGCVVLPLEELNVALAVQAAFDHDVPGSVGAVQQLVEFVLLEDEEFTGSCHVNREWRFLDQWALLKLSKVVPAVGRGKG